MFKVLDIHPIEGGSSSIEMINMLLSTKVEDNIAMEEQLIVIEFDELPLESIIYRKIFVRNYFRGKGFYVWKKDDKFRINTSVRECVDYIYTATPPALRNRIEKSIKTVENIIECMKTFLMENNNGSEELYRSLFFISFHLAVDKNLKDTYKDKDFVYNVFDKYSIPVIPIVEVSNYTQSALLEMIADRNSEPHKFYMNICYKRLLTENDIYELDALGDVVNLFFYKDHPCVILLTSVDRMVSCERDTIRNAMLKLYGY